MFIGIVWDLFMLMVIDIGIIYIIVVGVVSIKGLSKWWILIDLMG